MRTLLLILSFIALQANSQALFHAHNRVAYSPCTGVSDADACAFITAREAAGGSFTTAQKNALNTFYTGLKTNSLYTTVLEMWLPIGGVEAAGVVGLKGYTNLTGGMNRDFFVDGLDYTGDGWISTGIAGSALSASSHHLSYYSVENDPTQGADISSKSISGEVLVLYLNNGGGNQSYFFSANNSAPATVGYGGDTRGLYVAARSSASSFALYRNGTSIASGTASPGSIDPSAIVLGTNDYAPTGLRRCAFASVGGGMDAVQAATFTTLVNNLLTAFGVNTF
jgi:hypothetical protein